MAAVESELGCGLMGGIFWPRRTSVRSPATNRNTTTTPITKVKVPSAPKRPRGSSGESASLDSTNVAETPKLEEKLNTKLPTVLPRPSVSLRPIQATRNSDATRSSTSSSTSPSLSKIPQTPDSSVGQTLQTRPSSISGELNYTIPDHQQSSGSKTPVRASSGNAVLLGPLGNLRKHGSGNLSSNNLHNSSIKALDYSPRIAHEMSSTPKNGYGNRKLYNDRGMGNIVGNPSEESQQSGNRFRGLMKKLDPEALKSMGNEEYKQGRFEKALALYDRAIAVDSNKASYRSNKAAALMALGHLMDAVSECREAIRLEPSYHRAHHRLATLYLRLGEAEKALYHYKLSGPKADSEDIGQAQALKTHLSICTQAQKLRDWNTVLEETQTAISSGADSAPQIFALQAEALLKLYRHEEAYSALQKAPDFDIDACIQFFGLPAAAYLLIIESQVYMAMGRFEDAVASAECAIRLDSSNKELSTALRRVQAVASARLSGNQLFKASKFLEACVVYGEGLEHDPYNSVLLCNRATCRSKLGQFEKGIEDCTTALVVRPSYSKARLQRANCNAKLERWAAAIQDYEMLIRETPGDEEVGRALFEAQVQLKIQRGEDVKDIKFGSNLVFVSNNERFRHFVTSPGMSVVLFCQKATHKQVLQLMEQVCKKFPTVNFLKVDVEDHPYLARSEGVSSVPAFKIYKNGSRVKEIPCNNRDLLESSVKLYSS